MTDTAKNSESSKRATSAELQAARELIHAEEQREMEEQRAEAEKHLKPLRTVIDTEEFDKITAGVQAMLKEYTGNPQVFAHLSATNVGLQGLKRLQSPKS